MADSKFYLHNKSPQFLKAVEEFNPVRYVSGDFFYLNDVVSHYIIEKKDCKYRHNVLNKYLSSAPSRLHFTQVAFFLRFDEDLKHNIKEIIINKNSEERQEYLKKNIIRAIKNGNVEALKFFLDCGLIFSNKIKKELKQIQKSGQIEVLLERSQLSRSVRGELQKESKVFKM